MGNRKRTGFRCVTTVFCFNVWLTHWNKDGIPVFEIPVSNSTNLTQGKNIQTAYEQVPRFALTGETGEQLFRGISACQKQLDMPHKLSLHKILLLSSLPEEKMAITYRVDMS